MVEKMHAQQRSLLHFLINLILFLSGVKGRLNNFGSSG